MEKQNTVHAIFAPETKETEIKDDVWQHDFGQTLQIEGLSLPPTIEVHYANEVGDTAIPQVGVTKDGITTAPIPNEILSEKGAFTVYIFVTDGKSGETCYTITGYINKRPALKEFDTPEEQEIFHEAVDAVNKAAERAESAEAKATEAASQTSEDAAQTAEDREAIKNMVESVAGIDEQVKKVEEYTRQSQEAATQAGKAKEAAVAAKTSAEEAAQKTAEDKEAVELAKTEVDKAQKAVSEDRTAVEAVKESVEQLGNAIPEATQTGVQAVDQAKQTAINEIAQTGNTHKTAVEATGTKAVENVENVKETATKAIETAKTEAVKAVQTEGTTQTANVAAEGTKQLTVVQKAAQEIVADREQIKTNKADIADIKEEMDNLSSAIINSATGESIVVEDSSENRFNDLSLYGKSTQVTMTGAQLKINNDDITKTWKSTEAITENPIKFEIDSNSDLSTGGFLSFYSNSDIPDTVCYEPYILTENGTAGKWGNKSHFKITKGLNKVKLNAYSIKPTDYERLMVQIRRNTETLSYNGTFTLSYVFIKSGQNEAPYEPYTGGKPSPSIEYPQEIENVGANGQINVEIANDGYVEKGMQFDRNKKIPLKKGSYLCLKNNNQGTIMNAYIVNDADLISKLIYDKSSALYEYCRNELGLENLTPSGSIIKSNSRLANIWSNGLIYKIENDGLYLYYSNNASEHNSDNCYVWFLDRIGNTEKPYNSQSLTIPTPNGLRGLPVTYSNGNYTDETGQQWICDEIDLERGKYIQRVEKTDLKDLKWSDSWNKNPSYYIEGTFLVYSPNLNCEPTGKAKPLSNKFRHINNILRDPTTGMDTRQGGGRNIAFRVPVSIAENVEQWSEFVNNNDIEFIYALETPIEHDLPPEVIEAYKKLHTNYPVTTVLNDEGAGMKVEYVADVKNYIDNKFVPKAAYTDILNRIKTLETNALKEV